MVKGQLFYDNSYVFVDGYLLHLSANTSKKDEKAERENSLTQHYCSVEVVALYVTGRK